MKVKLLSTEKSPLAPAVRPSPRLAGVHAGIYHTDSKPGAARSKTPEGVTIPAFVNTVTKQSEPGLAPVTHAVTAHSHPGSRTCRSTIEHVAEAMRMTKADGDAVK